MTGSGHHLSNLPSVAESLTQTVPGDGRHEAGPATFSDCRTYRYSLTRVWEVELPSLMVIGLNPSTADENVLDPTLRRVRAFAKREGFGGFVMTNLFAFRATRPKDMRVADDPVGPDNDRWLEKLATECVNVLCAWGSLGGLLDRDRAVMGLLAKLQSRYGDDMSIMCLGTTAAGQPRHPLYIKGDQPMIPYLGR